jgi:hypothetical protein
MRTSKNRELPRWACPTLQDLPRPQRWGWEIPSCISVFQ